ncbi:MAG: helix-turn-helix domain-containing protein [Jatrophihabitans sp.]|uniref:helix-turn-helix domain-containing protein n=1 Tax=Jatrophihabitans sp. TaxID=1932789 RepID=UPI003F7D5273
MATRKSRPSVDADAAVSPDPTEADTEEGGQPHEPVGTLGVRLKRQRERSGMSLREVARQLGVSPAFVSQVERGKSQPSVATLYSLAQLLDVSIDELFAADTPEVATTPTVSAAGHGPAGVVASTRASSRLPSVADSINRSQMASIEDAWPRSRALAKLSVTRPGERHVLTMDSGVVWERLADNTGTGLDFLEIVYPPYSSSTTGQTMLQHVGSEYGYILEGELEITVGFEVLTLRAGEAIGFDSAVPHLLANRTDQVARGIWCVRHGYV